MVNDFVSLYIQQFAGKNFLSPANWGLQMGVICLKLFPILYSLLQIL